MKNIKGMYLLLLILPLGPLAQAELTGKVSPFYQSGFSKNLNTGGIGAELRYTKSFTDFTRISLEGQAEKDSFYTDESFAEVLNAFFEWRPGSAQIRLGMQTVQWEGTDVLNLADVVNSKNYIRPLNPVPRSSPTVRLSYELQSWELDFVFIPLRASHRYPNSRSYWLPRNKRIVLENEKTEVIVPESIDYELNPHQVLNSADVNNIGARTIYRGSLLDLTLFFFEGANISGSLILEGVPLEITPATVIQLTSPVRITPIEYRQRVVGGTLTKPFFNSWIFRFSASNTKPIGLDERIPKPQDAFVGSLEYSTEIFRKPTILSLGAYEIRKNDSSQLALLRSVFTKAFSFSGRLEWSDDNSGLWAFVYDSVGKSNLFHGEWDHRLSGRLSLGLSFDLFSGDCNTLLGSYREYDFYRTMLKYSF